ncbi:MAG: primosomal protein [Cyanobacteria bacterium QH_8_48_120]|nr:MAG: primosomal protein [Cyanobacteria bacterium QH_1_48_107]PSO59684.1 MAG: primosomal protein [Cyanobacteria bacterium QH_10_48_56]PSO61420.1 MAG: primosomal protein [Cyanobacteria bacterium QH_7_48_89]PSO62820.1 MAG: primosomal protein [Cyanobacteria bacterium QH_6_48_35]PSO67467.1 MAG: primosomal protein [Cyanobacteria bacterium QS_1_48_34]PSO68826.1 MAG: primosomal protein [Cyanobacteria bacterium QH_8_48_120]PSO70674.1 MAG: primosomal protein [Cyanobacteria bacterium QH_3_48_40]PSO8
MKNQTSQNVLGIVGGIIAALVVLVAFNSFVIINPGQAGVISIFGKAREGALLEGIHFKPPLVSKVDVYDVTVQKYEIPAQSATNDLQNLKASFAINFRLDPVQVVDIRRKQGTLENVVAKVIAPQTQESFKVAAARRTAEESITKRSELKEDFDIALGSRLEKYGIIILDTSVIDLNFTKEFASAVEDKQIAEQRAQKAVYVAREAKQQAQAEINRAKGKAEAQRLLAETLKAQGGELVLQKEAIEAWKRGGSQMPRVLVMGGDSNSSVPFLFNMGDLAEINQDKKTDPEEIAPTEEPSPFEDEENVEASPFNQPF